MKIVITGGGGFLASRLCQKLLDRGTLCGRPIDGIILLDNSFSRASLDARVTQVSVDIRVRSLVFAVIDTQVDVIFHLASMLSGECEERFDDALGVNLDGGRHVFEAARATKRRPWVIFASSVACFGGMDMSQMMSDQTKQIPQTTYGMTKAIGELLVNDYSRQGFIDGRSARLPSVIVRPGKPNAAASGWVSGMFREPLNGLPCLLPIRRDQVHPVTGYRTVIDSIISLCEVREEQLGPDRAYTLPAHPVTPQIAEKIIAELAAERGIKVGSIMDARDARIQGIVDTWSQRLDGSRTLAIGLSRPPELKVIVEQYLEDYCPNP